MKNVILTIALCLLFFSAGAQELVVKKWLVAGGIPVAEPALAATENVKGDKFKTTDLLKQPLLDLSGVLPKAGEGLKGTSIIWKEMAVETDSSLHFSFPEQGHQVAFLASYIEANNFWNGSIGVESTLPFEAYISDTKAAERYTEIGRASCRERV